MEFKTSLDTIIAALDMATQKGVFNMAEVKQIVTAVEVLVSSIDAGPEPIETIE
jgi:hypothetical protein